MRRSRSGRRTPRGSNVEPHVLISLSLSLPLSPFSLWGDDPHILRLVLWGMVLWSSVGAVFCLMRQKTVQPCAYDHGCVLTGLSRVHSDGPALLECESAVVVDSYGDLAGGAFGRVEVGVQCLPVVMESLCRDGTSWVEGVYGEVECLHMA